MRKGAYVEQKIFLLKNTTLSKVSGLTLEL